MKKKKDRRKDDPKIRRKKDDHKDCRVDLQNEMLPLPPAFTARMRKMLGEDDFAAFMAAIEGPRRQALRINILKEGWERFEKAPVFAVSPVPWADHGYYYEDGERPGKSPLHEAGLYYIQEPSAMAVAALSGVQPGERVLDLCAAPGGKSTHLAALMGDEGLLVANEIHPARAGILSRNVERMGIRCAVVTNEPPQRLAELFPGFFDRVIVDAPCSGEGMFRKEEQAIPNWSEANVERCALRQDEILKCAAQMVSAGGTIVYSTCTFAPQEDEGTAARFLAAHPDFSAVDLPGELGAEKMAAYGFAPGNPELAVGTLRLWPHRLDGEGHFIAMFRREGIARRIHEKQGSGSAAGTLRIFDRAADSGKRALWEAFAAETFSGPFPERIRGIPVSYGDQLYLLPEALDIRGISVLRPGLHLGDFRKGRFVPGHALALALHTGEVRSVYELQPEDPRVKAYLRGESIPLTEEGCRGWTLVAVDGYSIGWGKAAGGILKNHYPKGLRK